MLNIVVLVSGGGTNLQALLDAEETGKIRGGRIIHVISSNPDAYALERANRHGLCSSIVNRKAYLTAEEFDNELLKVLEGCEADLIVLAGFMCILGERVIQRYSNRIINVHPSLIPAFCGKGFYGLHVHKAALSYGVKLTGATVHFVNEIPDGGAIILQKAVEVHKGDTPEILQLRVMRQAEWEILPRAVSLFCEGKIIVKDNIATIED
ncbi:MAG: phosphoribosylglycinamide formyltransferase [Oscillospiraceae bacterium]|nr:phosphoribosylglycinamide formyltransferase [Oscillospiraceae bacterium]MDD4412958.1 phosphoribosylglycinamide formyltransferase [Oscillospiraceae bacterium]